MALATIVQLIGMYRQEVGNRKDLTTSDFMTWLESHRHEELKDLISNTHHLQEQVNVLLRDDHTKILGELESLSKLMLSMAKQFDSIAPIIDSSPSDIRLPDQSLAIIDFIHQNNAEGLQILHAGGGKMLALFPSGMTASVTEPQYLEEDCNALESMGYVRHSLSSGGDDRYIITRAGAEFAKQLTDENANKSQ